MEQVDEAIAQENSIKDTSVEFTSCRLSDIVDELKEALERQPATKDKEEKKALRKKKKQVMELEGYRDKLIEYDNHLDTLGERNSYSIYKQVLKTNSSQTSVCFPTLPIH